MKNYYKILELNDNCSEEDIKKQYKILAMKYHPDKGGDVEKFKDISEAYQILIDPNKRANYNNNNINNELNSVINANDLFKAFFSGRNNNIFNYRESLSTNKSNINIDHLFNNLSINTNNLSINTNNINNNIINETRQIYMLGNIKLEKIIQNKNGQKTEIIIETNLTTGEKKQKIRQIR